MKWSFSHSKTFKKCQLQWYLASQFGNANAKINSLQREVYLLSKLQSVFAWRGNLVDKVISEFIVPILSAKRPLKLNYLLSDARKLFENQLNFAKERHWRDVGMTSESGGNAYAALHEIEYEIDFSKNLAQAWTDVQQALKNLLAMTELLAELQCAVKLIPQRNLSFDHYGLTVKARPDLIALFRDRPPLIVDWKVHSFGQHDYRLQLATYALALKRSKAHSDIDFPTCLQSYSVTDIKLVEIQLLTAEQREYALTDIDVDETESYISVIGSQMQLAVEDLEGEDVFQELSTAPYPETCQRCNFQKLCWKGTLFKKEEECQSSKQMSFLF